MATPNAFVIIQWPVRREMKRLRFGEFQNSLLALENWKSEARQESLKRR